MPFNSKTATQAGKLSSRKGVPNKTTTEIKEAYQKLIEDNLSNMNEWLENIGKENPEKAFDILIKMSDFIVPKLSRQELKIEPEKLTPEERREKLKQLKEKLSRLKL